LRFAFFAQAALRGAGACVNGLSYVDEALHDCLAQARADGVVVMQARARGAARTCLRDMQKR
jgi:hypothetical protein